MKKIIFIIILFVSMVNVSAHDKLYKGLYSWGEGVHSFLPCGERMIFWVSADWALETVLQFYKTHAIEPYQQLYIEFRGHILEEKLGGFAEDYNGLIRVSEVKQFTFHLPSYCQ